MNTHGEFKNGRDRGSSLLSYVGLRGSDLESSTDCIPVDRLTALVNGGYHIPAVPTVTTDPRQGEVAENDAVAAGVGSAAGLLELAQKLHDEYVAEGQTTHDHLVSEAEQKRDAILRELASERALLEKKIEDLRTLERDHHAFLKSYFEGQLIELENAGADQSGADSDS